MATKLIAACGLVCSDCDAFQATQAKDAAAIERIAAEWSKEFGADIPPEAVWCDGCMTGGEHACGHVAECQIRACVVERGLANCAPCSEFGCGMLEEFLEMVPSARQTLADLRSAGP